MTPHTWRDVPLSTLREWAREESDSTSRRRFSSSVRIGRTTLARFLDDESVPHPRICRSLALAYLEAVQESAGAAVNLQAAVREHHQH